MPNVHKAHKRGITNEKRMEINQRESERAPTPEELEQRAAAMAVYARDFKKFYLDLLASDTVNKITKKSYKQTWGKIHDFMVDFLNIGDDVVTYSPLMDYMPEKNEDGDYIERWLYWRTMDGPPEIQDGSVGPLTEMFRDKFWQGLLIRVKGDGLSKCLLIPRGHLKSTIATQARSLWRIVREPDSRTLIRSLTEDTAKMFCGDVKFAFESNAEFRALYGGMATKEKHEPAPWNADALQVRNNKGFRKSRGKEPTLRSAGMNSSLTSMHCDYVTLDDVVGEGNTETVTLRAQARGVIGKMMAIPDPGSPFEDIGTRWEDDDVHSMFIDPDRSDMEQDTSFMIATVLDGDTENVEGNYVHTVPRHISPLGYGKPIWPEAYTLREIARKRRSMKDDREWFSQYFNQFMGTGLRTFSKSWIKNYEGNPLEVARAKHLNIFIYFDTTSGKKIQTGKLDFTCGIVLGQTPDCRSVYVLDGFAEKIPSALMVRAIVNLSRKWHAEAERYGGTFFAGVEDNAYTNHLDTAIMLLLKQESVNKHVAIHGVSHGNRQKSDRIAMLAQPYRDGMILWPHELVTHSSLNEPDLKQREENFEPYDFIEMLKVQFCSWPGTANDDILDAHAGAYSRTNTGDFKNDPEEKKQMSDPSIDRRSDRVESQNDEGQLGEYGSQKKWSLV